MNIPHKNQLLAPDYFNAVSKLARYWDIVDIVQMLSPYRGCILFKTVWDGTWLNIKKKEERMGVWGCWYTFSSDC